MTCRGCARTATAALDMLGTVREVTVDLPTGQATVVSDGPLPANQVADAVRRVGYELTTLRS
ncbi:heavy-metal-associated domain-containing protein [Planomonospora parontospora]|uniref:heavy-metal-associated domain-containing protein n=1 Tax=Planomonospora parontospora TaxID=58119 RepID=UPI0019451D22|nr:heavy metal-associated domain-containing protein [Planomonospora parontospora]